MNDAIAKPLRSQEWFGRTDKDGFIHRSWMKNQGLPHHVFDGRPAIGICNTFSELTPCNAHFRELAEYVKRGVWEAGGVRNGDMIELDVAARKLQLEVGDEELARRRAAWSPPEPAMRGGYQRLYVDHVMQADRGADLDFLVGCRGAAVPRESH